MEKRNTFNNIITDYNEARPSYPAELFNDILEFSNISVNDNLLEIGSGTGQATEYFIEKGYPIIGLEIDSGRAAGERRLYITKQSARVPGESHPVLYH